MGSSFRIAAIAVMGFLSIYFYYFYYTFHNENKGYYVLYLILAFSVYGIYKLFQNLGNGKVKVTYSHLFVFLCIQVFLLSTLFVGISGQSALLGTVIFLKVLLFLILVGILWLVIYSFGKTILKKFHYFRIKNSGFRILGSIGLGFLLFNVSLFLLAAVGFYNIVGISILIVAMVGISYKYLMKTAMQLKNHSWTFETYDPKQSLRLFIDEMHYFVISLLLAVNLLSVYRPFPIGWDDLGAYMNLPKILAGQESLVSFGKNYAWELYTGIGHAFSSQTFAFSLNSFSGILLAIVAYIAFKGIFRNDKTFFNVPLLGVMVLLMLPMSIFQLAKDMKLDVALLSLSIIPVYMIFSYFLEEKKEEEKKNNYLYFLLIGLLVGLCFTIKITSLLLLLGILGMIMFFRGGIYGFFAFLGFFIGIFSLGNLWKMMNIIFPSDAYIFSIASMILGGVFLFLAFQEKKEKTTFQKMFVEIGVVILGFIIAFLPWGVKNLHEGFQSGKVNIGVLVSGKSDAFTPEFFTEIYSLEELAEIKNNKKSAGLTSSGTTTNEDFGRYFGYEQGINNYLKLPWNLTFQVNQKGEFTEISYIFFALIPVVFLFLPYRKEAYKYVVLGSLALLVLYYIPEFRIPLGGGKSALIQNDIGLFISNIFSHITLPYGYFFIISFFLLPFIFFYNALDKEQKVVKIFLASYAFSSIYVFLWSISSFGVVWYGIVMYFIFFIMIAVSLISAHETDANTGYKGIYMVLAVIWIYVLVSVIPHGVTNMRAVGYLDYKLGRLTEEETLMNIHSEYFPILFELNIEREHHDAMFKEYRNKLLEIIDDIPDSLELLSAIQGVGNITQLKNNMSELIKFDLGGKEYEIEELRQKLYEEILYPNEKRKSTELAYRAGTFLKYYISDNNKRLYEDNLIEGFEMYFYDEDPKIIKERLSTLGIGYILLDLNASTIDNDPRKELTKRYEKLLEFTNTPGISLVETDSICLKLARDDYKKLGNKELFINTATLNHGNRIAKKTLCINRITELIKSKSISQTNYPYLYRFQMALESLKIDSSDDAAMKGALNQYVTQGYKALFKIDE